MADRAAGLEELPPLEVAGRIEGARARLHAEELDALLVTALANVRYLTGFSGSAGVAVITGGGVLLTTDGRYRTQSSEEVEAAGVGDQVVIEIGGADAQRHTLRDHLRKQGARRIGLEAESVSWAASRRWRELLADSAGPVELVPTIGLIEALREVKDAGEIARMARAAAIADAALGDVRELLSVATRRTITETEMGLALDSAMRRRGAEDRAFETIVAAGPNAAEPHHRPTTRPIAAGDPVVIDFGAVFDGYRSDMTRTFSVGGEPTGKLARVFEVVADAQAKGVAAVRSGVGAKEVDSVCRQVVEEAGLGHGFEHGTGHGVGLDIHEAPTVSPLGTAILETSMVVTVEPGVYLRDVGGVRIEDMLVVTGDGSRALTCFPKDVAV